MVSEALTGVFRSLRVYQGAGAPRADMDRLYRRFISPGDLVFDIGAHVGDRVSSFRRLGARVVALEPQPLLLRTLKLIHGHDRDVVLLSNAVAAKPGMTTLHVNTRNPTVSTLSHAFVQQAAGADGWHGQSWDDERQVAAVTIDALIADYGRPAFIKIDIEGYEDEALLGLASAVPALSFEFTTICRDCAKRCLERISALGDYRFDVALGESQKLTFERWVTAREMLDHLEHLPHAANSGDVYATVLWDA